MFKLNFFNHNFAVKKVCWDKCDCYLRQRDLQSRVYIQTMFYKIRRVRLKYTGILRDFP